MYASVAYGAVVRVPLLASSPAEPVFFTPAAVAAAGGVAWDARRPLTAHPLFAWCVAQARAGNTSAETTCGRPLGIRIVNSSTLFVADAYFGIFRAPLDACAADGAAAQAAWLVRPTDATPRMRLFNDLAIGFDGAVFFTDSSWIHSRRAHVALLLNNDAPTGRLFRKPPGEDAPLQLLASRLHFPNGVELLPPHDAAVVVSELGRMRLLRCALPAPCALTVFADALPGVVDNIRLAADGRSLLVGAGTKMVQPFSLLYALWTQPHAGPCESEAAAAAPSAQEDADENAEDDINSGAGETRYGLVLRLGLDGTPLGSLHDATGRIARISHAHEQRDGTLWLGSASNAYAARLPPPAAG
jgi:hypothetical protein